MKVKKVMRPEPEFKKFDIVISVESEEERKMVNKWVVYSEVTSDDYSQYEIGFICDMIDGISDALLLAKQP